MGKRSDEIVVSFSAPPTALDETVASIMDKETSRRDEMQLSPAERRKVIEQRRKDTARKEKAKAKARSQSRVTLIIPNTLMQRIESIATWHGVTTSQVVTFLLFEAADLYEKGAIRFDGHKQPSYNPRYDFELVHPKDTERQSRRSAKKRKNGWG